MSNRQFVAVQFNPWDRRSYTYHNDGEPVAVQAPPFETKPIDGIAPPEDEPEGPAAA